MPIYIAFVTSLFCQQDERLKIFWLLCSQRFETWLHWFRPNLEADVSAPAISPYLWRTVSKVVLNVTRVYRLDCLERELTSFRSVGDKARLSLIIQRKQIIFETHRIMITRSTGSKNGVRPYGLVPRCQFIVLPIVQPNQSRPNATGKGEHAFRGLK